MSTEWKGTGDEGVALLGIIEKNCECQVDQMGRKKLCPGHLMLLSDQRSLDGLIWMKRSRESLQAQEGITVGQASGV